LPADEDPDPDEDEDPDEDDVCGAPLEDVPPEAGVEVNSRGAVEVEAAFASSALRGETAVDEDEAVDAEEAPASACSGPNSRLALAAAESATVARSPAGLEDAPRTGALTSGTSWALATDELRASWAPDAPAPDTRSMWR
jgi:hypothetical protein